MAVRSARFGTDDTATPQADGTSKPQAEAEKQTRARADDDDDEPEPPEFEDLPWKWEGKGKNKERARNEYNLRLALQYLGVSVGFNEFNYKEEIKGLPHHGPWLDDAAIDALWAYIGGPAAWNTRRVTLKRCWFR